MSNSVCNFDKGATVMILFIEYPKCGTCRKAKKWLEENGLEFNDRNIVTDNPTFDELKEWSKLGGIPIRKLFNTSGLLYKSMGLKDKLSDISDDEMLNILASDGMLVKRPLVIGDNFVLSGFKEDVWKNTII